MSRGAKTLGWTILVLLFLGLLELFSYLAVKNLGFLRFFAYSEPKVTQEQFEDYMQNRHPLLGWPSKKWLAEYTVETGARISPVNEAFGDAGPCISLYGDSFAYGDEATHDEAWANVLAGLMNCRVDNFGIGGYGLDQALLRFEGHLEQGHDLAATIIYTIYPDDLNRNMNQWRYLLGSHPFSFKPVFHITDKKVVFEPQFNGSFDDFKRISNDPSSALNAESYSPDANAFRRPVTFSFPYTLTFAKIGYGLFDTIRGDAPKGYAFLNNYPAFYDSELGMSEEKQDTADYILERFQQRCSEANKRCYVILLPDPELVYQASLGKHDFEDWLAAQISTAEYLDATDIFTDLVDICSHLTNPEGCNGHYNANGYARLAKFVAENLD